MGFEAGLHYLTCRCPIGFGSCIARQSAAATATENSILCCHPNSKASCGAKIPASTPPMGTPVNRIEKIRFLFFALLLLITNVRQVGLSCRKPIQGLLSPGQLKIKILP